MNEEFTPNEPDEAIMMARELVTAYQAEWAQSLQTDPRGSSGRSPIDWAAVRDAVAGASSLELAVGRAVVLAAKSARGDLVGQPLGGVALDPALAHPFFSFNVSDVVPDFGDHRPRTRFNRRVTRILRRSGASSNRRGAHAPSASGKHWGVEGGLPQPSLS
jgi:hypothetical protein